MSKVLYIKANIKEEGQSRTFKVSDSFIDEYKRINPNDEIITLDLYKENIDFLRPNDLGERFGQKTEEGSNNPLLKYAYQFAQADKYIIAAPLWNLSIPSILKAYIDYISVVGVTFKYTAEGPIGLLNNKKAVHIVSRGGEYGNSPYEMGDKYLRVILGFLGIQDIKTIAIEGVDVAGADVESIVEDRIKEAKKYVQEF